ncbi:MAG: hypothetical protein WKG01_02970 [Kofleriaceae bacterium]
MTRLALAMVVACASTDASHRTVVQSDRLPVAANVGVLELGEDVFVFSRDLVSIIRDGQVIHRVPGSWASPMAITLPDRAGAWVVAVSNGQLLRVVPEGDPEPVGAHFGIADEHVLAIAAAGPAFVAGMQAGTVASADGSHVKRFTRAPGRLVAAARHKVAIAGVDDVALMDLEAGTVAMFAVRAPERIAFLDPEGAAPRLVVFDGIRAFVETAGVLNQVAASEPVRQIAPAGAGLWLIVGSSLQLYDGNELRHTLVTISANAQIFGTPSGDVWISDPELVRYTTGAAIDASWQREVAPVFERACARCHRPGGPDDAGVNLSSARRWRALRAEIRARVLVDGDMPPEEATPLRVDDRRVLERWLSSP